MRRLAFAPLLFATAALAARDPSEVIFPAQTVPLKFSHAKHLGTLKLACDFCHEKAPISTSAKDDLLPKEDVCETCHPIDREHPNKPDDHPERHGACSACHQGADPTHPPRVDLPAPNLKFNHKVHGALGIRCERCHGDMKGVELGTRANLPTMPLCLGCHNSTAQEHRAPSKCTTCHVARWDGTLETQFPSGILTPSGTLKNDAHTLQFATEHKSAAQDGAYCESCHRKEFCQSCHNGVLKPLAFHGNDYLSLHAIDARKASTDCNGCHRRQTFCLGCHERVGVVDKLTADGKSGLPSIAKRFHPPYAVWVQAPRTPEHHSYQAERNLRTCTACHREDTCLECHSAIPGGIGRYTNVNPHPAGFAGSRTCQALASRNARVCLKCHAPNDSAIVCK